MGGGKHGEREAMGGAREEGGVTLKEGERTGGRERKRVGGRGEEREGGRRSTWTTEAGE